MNQEVSFRAAAPADASRIAELVSAAYRHYVERIGRLPRPMTQDYAEVISRCQVTVAERQGVIAGVIVLVADDEGFLIENIAVDPTHQGKRLGRALLQYAETQAHDAGYDSIYLYTHEKMTENQAIYAKLGYLEYDRRSMGDFSLVYMRKQLA